MDKTGFPVTSTIWSLSTNAVGVWKNEPHWLVAGIPVLSTTQDTCAELKFKKIKRFSNFSKVFSNFSNLAKFFKSFFVSYLEAASRKARHILPHQQKKEQNQTVTSEFSYFVNQTKYAPK